MGTHGTRSKNSLLVLYTAGVWFSACVMVLALIEGHAAGQCVEHKLLASDGAVFDSFGSSVSITGTPGYEVAIVGKPGDDVYGGNSGSAYIYRFNLDTSGWVEEAKLLASDGAAGDAFGKALSISGLPGNEVVIVGAWRNDDSGTDTGSAYIYRYNGVSWAEEQKLLASDGAAGNAFGESTLIISAPGNEVAIVGAFWDDDNGFNSGSAYIFRKSGPPGNEIAIVGASFNDDNGTDSGSVYIFELACSPLPCPADTDCSGEVNVFDLLLLLGNWGPCPAPCASDINDDGSVNVTDLLALLAAWGSCSVP